MYVPVNEKMAKTHWQTTPDSKTACGREVTMVDMTYSPSITRNAADVDCKTCLKLIPEATLTVWDRILDEDAKPIATPPVKKMRRRPKPTTVFPVGRRAGMSYVAAREVLNRANSMTEGFNAAYGVEDEEAETSQPEPVVQYRIRIPNAAFVFITVLVLLSLLRWFQK